MPPFKAVVAKQMSVGDAKSKAAAFNKLPERVGGKRSSTRVKKATPRRSTARGK